MIIKESLNNLVNFNKKNEGILDALFGTDAAYTFQIFGRDKLNQASWKLMGEYEFDTKDPKKILSQFFQSIITGKLLKDERALYTFLDTKLGIKGKKFRIVQVTSKESLLSMDNIKSGLTFSKMKGPSF